MSPAEFETVAACAVLAVFYVAGLLWKIFNDMPTRGETTDESDRES